MTTLHESLVANGIKCLDSIHKLLALWLIAAAGLILLPSEGAPATLRLPLFDVPVQHFLANALLGALMFAIGFFGSEMLGQARSITIRLGKSEQLLALLSYPSIATFRTSLARFFVGLLLVYLQFIVGLVLATPKDQLILWPQLLFAFVFSMPMMWFAYRLTEWVPGDIDVIQHGTGEG
jgi:hypothetical protein